MHCALSCSFSLACVSGVSQRSGPCAVEHLSNARLIQVDFLRIVCACISICSVLFFFLSLNSYSICVVVDVADAADATDANATTGTSSTFNFHCSKLEPISFSFVSYCCVVVARINFPVGHLFIFSSTCHQPFWFHVIRFIFGLHFRRPHQYDAV